MHFFYYFGFISVFYDFVIGFCVVFAITLFRCSCVCFVLTKSLDFVFILFYVVLFFTSAPLLVGVILYFQHILSTLFSELFPGVYSGVLLQFLVTLVDCLQFLLDIFLVLSGKKINASAITC